jgi:predicted transcriptional regulator
MVISMSKLMIKTPCTTFTLESIMCCIFGIKTFDVMVYFTLLNNGALRVNDIAELLNRDRSTIQRSVQSLVNAGLVRRKQINLKEGGYYYIYEAIPFSDVKNIIKDTMEKWCSEVKEWIDGMNEEDLKRITEDVL